ncbi:MAG: sugar ABC transporter permease [Clostridia bacterium]|nr:sugar ABC transporter permease [Clostridia bacterium]
MQRINKRKRPTLTRVLFILMCTVPSVVYFSIFYIYVNINSFVMAFYTVKDGTIIWTLNNFKLFLEQIQSPTSELSTAFKNTLITFIIGNVMFVVGFFVSYFLYKKVPMYKVFRICFFLPGLIAGTIVSSIFMRIVGVDGPIAPTVQKLFRLEYVPTLLADPQFANYVIWGNMIWLGFPGNMILFGGTLSRLPESVLEQGKLDGVNWLQEAFLIIIPVIWPMISLMLVLNIAGFFGASGNVFLLTQGNYGTQTISNWMFMQVYNTVGSVDVSNAYNYLSSVGLILTIISVAVALSVRRIANSYFEGVTY